MHKHCILACTLQLMRVRTSLSCRKDREEAEKKLLHAFTLVGTIKGGIFIVISHHALISADSLALMQAGGGGENTNCGLFPSHRVGTV
jgi:hypothetical protein